jgi:sterol 3beta-glucosyltransferase
VGITHEVCRAGRPSLCVPHFPDQHFWGRLIARRGLGPPPLAYDRLAVRVLAERIDDLVSEPRYAAHAAEVGRALVDEDGVGRSADLIEAL